MIRKLADLFRRAKLVIRNDGSIAFIRSAFTFIVSRIFFYKTYYLYKYDIEELDEAAYLPRTQDFTLKIVSSNREADEMAADGYDMRYWYPVYSKRLDKGAVAFCLFIGRELAHIGWVGVNSRAKASLGEVPYKVSYSNNEAFSGCVWTDPKYRRLGLQRYGYFKRRQFLKDCGKTVGRAAIATNNAGTITMAEKIGAQRYGRGRLVKLLGWQFWKERPVNLGAARTLDETFLVEDVQ